MDEQSRLHIWLISLAVHMTSIFLDERTDLVESELANAYFGPFASVIKTPGGSAWWTEARPFIHPIFARRLDEIVASDLPSQTSAFSWYAADARDPQEA